MGEGRGREEGDRREILFVELLLSYEGGWWYPAVAGLGGADRRLLPCRRAML
jgi:hypothetical protein